MTSLQTPNQYTRWTETPAGVVADILNGAVDINYDQRESRVRARIADGGTCVDMDPDTARMIGVRLIEAATRAEGDRKIRKP